MLVTNPGDVQSVVHPLLRGRVRPARLTGSSKVPGPSLVEAAWRQVAIRWIRWWAGSLGLPARHSVRARVGTRSLTTMRPRDRVSRTPVNGHFANRTSHTADHLNRS